MMALGLLCFWAPGFPNPGYRPSTSLPLLAREQQLIILVQAARSPRVSTMSRWSTSPSSTGKSPFMDMMMSPVYADGDADQGKVTVSSRIQQNLGVRTAEVTEGTLSPQLSAVGSIAFNERDQAIVQARATGYVERLHVRATLDPVAKGQPLVSLYVPDWIAAQEEFLSVRRMKGTDLGGLVDGARQRMRQVGMDDAQIALVERSGQTQPRITLSAPLGGVAVGGVGREGMRSEEDTSEIQSQSKIVCRPLLCKKKKKKREIS